MRKLSSENAVHMSLPFYCDIVKFQRTDFHQFFQTQKRLKLALIQISRSSETYKDTVNVRGGPKLGQIGPKWRQIWDL